LLSPRAGGWGRAVAPFRLRVLTIRPCGLGSSPRFRKTYLPRPCADSTRGRPPTLEAARGSGCEGRAVPPLPVKGLNFLVLRFKVAAGRFEKLTRRGRVLTRPVAAHRLSPRGLVAARRVEQSGAWGHWGFYRRRSKIEKVNRGIRGCWAHCRAHEFLSNSLRG
jgi:hypothetical protein